MITFQYNSFFRTIYTLVIFSGVFAFFSCATSHVQVSETQAQRIAVGESSRATVIDVFLNDVEEGVEFEYLVYNRQKVNVSVESTSSKQQKVSALVQNGAPMVEGTEQETVNEPNQLVYTKNGKQHAVKLDNINFLPTKISN